MARSAPGDDLRTRRTRSALLRAFNRLVLTRRYERFGVREIIQEAGVGRSTLYEHFRGKEGLLRHAMSGMLDILADAPTDSANPALVRRVLEHWWENRQRARDRLASDSRAEVTRWLGESIERRIAGAPLSIPLRLAAAHIAEAQIGLVRAWLDGVHSCPADRLAAALIAASRSHLRALSVPSASGPNAGELSTDHPHDSVPV